MSTQDDKKTLDWKLYESGISFNNSKDVVNTAKINTDFYEGNQWIGAKDTSLPKPTFNVLKRVGSYFIASLTSNPIKAYMSPLMFENFDRQKALDYNLGSQMADMVNAIDIADATLNKILERNKFQDKVRDALTRSCKTGDMVFHIRFDTSIKPYVYLLNSIYKGDIVIDVIDGINVFFGDANTKDVEKQPYIIISGRDTVEHLKEEMKSKNGDIQADTDTEYFLKQDDEIESDEDSTNKCTYIIKYYKKKVKNKLTGEEEYRVYANKSTRTAVIYEGMDTGLSLYPVAFGNWDQQAGNYHGRALVTGLIPNQIFINRMWAMMMYHLQLNAFPKPIYNASRISQWSSDIGVAIPVTDNGEPNFDINNMAKYIEPSAISSQVTNAIDLCMSQTKDMLGISDASLGNVNPTNTSAIVAVQKSSAVPLKNQQANLYQFVEDAVMIILDMIASKYGIRDVAVDMKTVQPGNVVTMYDFSQLKDLALSLNIDIGQGNYYDEIAQLQTVDNLLMQGQISLKQYLERIPDSVLPKRQELLKEIEVQEQMAMQGMGTMPPSVPQVTGSQGGNISQGKTNDELLQAMQSQSSDEQLKTMEQMQ